LNQLPSLHRLLSESRKYWGCPILGTQTEAQITKIYGAEDTRTILQGTKTKLILNCTDPQTAETMAKVIGKQEFIHTSENHSRSHHSGRSGNGRTVTLNEQPRESYAVMPDELVNLRDLHGYLKIAEDCAAVKLKPKKFAARARRFVPLPNSSTDQNIQDQWRNLEE
jgi:type IV secretory pathway TraG/TraD family ATPase VirD4